MTYFSRRFVAAPVLATIAAAQASVGARTTPPMVGEVAAVGRERMVRGTGRGTCVGARVWWRGRGWAATECGGEGEREM